MESNFKKPRQVIKKFEGYQPWGPVQRRGGCGGQGKADKERIDKKGSSKFNESINDNFRFTRLGKYILLRMARSLRVACLTGVHNGIVILLSLFLLNTVI